MSDLIVNNVVARKKRITDRITANTMPVFRGPWTQYTGKLPSDAATISIYNFNGTVTDSSGNGYDLTVVSGGPVLYNSNSAFDQAALFKTNGAVVSSSNAVFNFGTGSCTLEVWMNTTASSGTNTIFNKGSTSGNRLILQMLSTGKPQWFFSDGTTNFTVNSSTAVVNDGKWHHVAGVLDFINSASHLYIDGVEAGTAANLAAMLPIGVSSSGGFAVGVTTAKSNWFNGMIDQVRISNIARTVFPTTTGSTLVWSTPYTGSEILATTFNGTQGRRKYAAANITGSHDWYFDILNDAIYVYSSGSTPTITYSSIVGHTKNVRTTRFGVDGEFALTSSPYSQSLQLSASIAMGVRFVRNPIEWQYIQYSPADVGPLATWQTLDQGVYSMYSASIPTVLVFDGAPYWVTGVADTGNNEYMYFVPTGSVQFAGYLTASVAFAITCSMRYKGIVHHWEIWNEPNTDVFWSPVHNASQYAIYYQSMSQAILSVDPTNNISIGGLSAPTYWGGAPVDGDSAITFLGQLYASGVMPTNVALHPYPDAGQAPDAIVAQHNNFTDIGVIADFMAANGNTNANIWLTEWGWENSGSVAVSQASQSVYMKRSLELIRDRYPLVTIATYYQLFDTTTFYGLLDTQLKPKPAAAIFSQFVKANSY